MLTLPVYNTLGEEVGTFEVDENVLGGKVRRRLMHDAIIMYQANLRTGTAHSKTRAEVIGSTKKLYRQKGTGNARAGSVKSPVRRGGGVAFGPRHRDFHYHMPLKSRRAALKSALLSKIIDNETILLDQIEIDQPKTKQIADILKNLKIERTCLFAIEERSDNIWKSARNIAGLSTKVVADVNAYDVLKPHRMLMTKAALEGLLQSFGRNKGAES